VTVTDQPAANRGASPTAGLSVQHADALWDAIAIPGPRTPTFTEQHERVCRAVANIVFEVTAGQSPGTDQLECSASRTGHCLREAESETACNTEAGECVHGGRAARTDTLPAWLHQRFDPRGPDWDQLDEDDRSYWEHQARAVRRAVARGGFKQSADEAQQPKEA
jgi:hypothetical protein